MTHETDQSPPVPNVVLIRPAADLTVSPPPAEEEDAHVEQDASTPDVLDFKAEARDSAADQRDSMAELRAAQVSDLHDPEAALLSRLLAARDRAAASLDRQEAALDRHRAAAYLRRSYRDELTGAMQRDAGRDQLAHEVDRAHRHGEPMLFAFLDVVSLKKINDELGHATGDEVLRAVGSALASGLRSYDIVVRYGGDEFVCGLPQTNIADSQHRFNAVEQILSEEMPGASVSVGLADLQPEETLDEVIGRADRALYDGRKQLADKR